MPSSAPKKDLPTHFSALFNCASLDSFRSRLNMHLREYDINDAHPDTETTLLAHLAQNAETPLHIKFIEVALEHGAAPELIDMNGKKALDYLSFLPTFGFQTEEQLATFKTDIVKKYNEAHQAEFKAKTLIQPGRLDEFELAWENEILARYRSDVPLFEELSADVQFKGLILKLRNHLFVSPDSFENLGLFLSGIKSLVVALEQAVQAKIADAFIGFGRAEKINACNQRFGAIKSILNSVIKKYETQASFKRGKEIASREAKQEAAHSQQALGEANSLLKRSVVLLGRERKKVATVQEQKSFLEQALKQKQTALSAAEEKNRETQAQAEHLNALLAEQAEKSRQAQIQLDIMQAAALGANAYGVLGQTASMLMGFAEGVAWTLGLSNAAQPGLSPTLNGHSSLTSLLSDSVVELLAREVLCGGQYFTLQNNGVVTVPQTVHMLKEALSQTTSEERGKKLNLVLQRVKRIQQGEKRIVYKTWLGKVAFELGKLFPENEAVTQRSTGPQIG